MAIKVENCPMCDKLPNTLSVGGLHVTCCMPCTNVIGPNGQAGSTVTESKKNWNKFAVAMREAIAQDKLKRKSKAKRKKVSK